MNLPYILIIDDEPVVRTYLRRVMTPLSAGISEASSCEEALKIFAGSKFDVAVIDVNLGKDNGIDLAGFLLGSDPALAVIVMSGDPNNEEKVRKAGLGCMLLKPFTFEDLKANINLRKIKDK